MDEEKHRPTAPDTHLNKSVTDKPKVQAAAAAAHREQKEDAPESQSNESALIVGAKTIAGAGLGLIVVVGAVTAIGALAEAILIPSLLVKVAGGLAGGGLGLAKGLKDERKKQ